MQSQQLNISQDKKVVALKAKHSFNFAPENYNEALHMAQLFAQSSLCPANLRNKPADVFLTWQLGAELGLSPLKASMTIGVINGIPFTYGTGKLALIRRHPKFRGAKEWFEGELEKGNLTAYCIFLREGEEEIVKSFSIKDAIKADLLQNSKKPIWSLYTKDMLMNRARSRAADASFSDALFGLHSEEDAREISSLIPSEDKNKNSDEKKKGMEGLKQSLGIKKEEKNDNFIDCEIVDGEDLEDKLQAESANDIHIFPHDELKKMLEEGIVSKENIEKLLIKEGVEKIEDLRLAIVLKCIERIKLKKLN